MTWSDPAFRAIVRAIASCTGLAFPSSRHAEVEAALRRALPTVTDADALRALLARDDAAREALIAELTVGETYFFREPEQFALLRRIIPRLAAQHGERPLRVWSAGCASGEEPYSIAIVCDQLGLGRRVSILGTDLSRARLAAAQQGVYRPWSFRGVPAEIIDRYFERTGTTLRIRAELRERVEFRYLNLADDQFPSLASGAYSMDLILCRNVLIYFDRDTVARVARRLVDTLAQGGWLLVGASDPAIGERTDVEVSLTPAGLAYRRRGADEATDAAPAPVEPSDVAAADAQPAESAEPSAGSASAPEIDLPVTSSEDAAPDDDAAALDALDAAYRDRDYEQAHALATRLIARGTGGVRPWLVRIRAFANRGLLDDAGRAAAAALERYRDSAELLYLHAMLLAQSEQHAQAAATARQALYLDPDLVVAHLVLADARSRLGDVASARRALRNAEAALSRMPADAAVAGADGQSVARLRQLVRTHLLLLAA